MLQYYAEFFGTALLILLGDGVVANVCLAKTKGNNSGWIVIAFGWAFAVGIPAYIFGPASGASFNPALTIALAVIGNLSWSVVPGYILSEILGGVVGGMAIPGILLAYYFIGGFDNKKFTTLPPPVVGESEHVERVKDIYFDCI